MASSSSAETVDRCTEIATSGRQFSLLVGCEGDLFESPQGAAGIIGCPRWDGPYESCASEHGQAAALFRAYQDLGTRLFDSLHGTFACAVFDSLTGMLLLANDRMGVVPMAYHQRDDLVVFGSTIQGLSRHPSVPINLSAQAIFNYFYFHTIPSPRTIYASIRKLEPAQLITFDRSTTRAHLYWNPSFVERSAVPRRELAEETCSVLRIAVNRCNRNPSIGAFLSGGIDSSTVVGMLKRIGIAKPRSYTISFGERGYDELSYARTAARHFGSPLSEYQVTPADILSNVASIATACDEPFGNSSILPAFCCARAAKLSGVALLVAGDGGDELFAGNERYAKQKLFEAYSSVLPKWFRTPFDAALFAVPSLDGVALIRKARRFVSLANTPLPDRLQDYNFLERVRLSEVFQDDFLAEVDPSQPIRMLREVYTRARSDNPLNKMLYLDWRFTLADNDLKKVSTACALAGIDICYPFLDDDVVELSTRVPADWKLEGLRLRAFFKYAMRDFLPRRVLRKRKHGFGLPFGVWLRTHGELRDFAYAAAHSFAQRAYVRTNYVERLLHAHQTEHAAYYGTMIWLMMMMELWLRARNL
jgi:asparagine synthase (glutamine-hydrolysing)